MTAARAFDLGEGACIVTIPNAIVSTTYTYWNNDMLNDEIADAQRTVRTDAYQMSISEIVSMYSSQEIVIAPEFQRLFRWTNSQKSKLIDSLLLGIPIPSIFVFENENGDWELVDGLQRLSTILEFMGILQLPEGGLQQPSILEATRYLPSLHNVVWEKSDQIEGVPLDQQFELDRTQRLAIRRSRIGVEILKRPSDENTKFDLFQRLNAGGTVANAQELRNCLMLMVNAEYFRAIKQGAEGHAFNSILSMTADQLEKQRHMEWAVRFLVHTRVPYDGYLDIQEYIDTGIIQLSKVGQSNDDRNLLNQTFDLLNRAVGENALKRYQDGQYGGRVGLVGLEVIAVGVAKNLDAILAEPDPEKYVRTKSQTFWSQPDIERFNSLGMRGTTRISRTIPFGEEWFRP